MTKWIMVDQLTSTTTVFVFSYHDAGALANMILICSRKCSQYSACAPIAFTGCLRSLLCGYALCCLGGFEQGVFSICCLRLTALLISLKGSLSLVLFFLFFSCVNGSAGFCFYLNAEGLLQPIT